MRTTAPKKNKAKKILPHRFFLLVFIFIVVIACIIFINNSFKQAPEILDRPISISYTTQHADEIYEDEILRFAVIADAHIGQNWHGREGGNSERLRRALEVAREHKAEFFVALGDITQTGSKEEFEEAKAILDSGKIRYYTTPGNHDVFQNQTYYDKKFGPKFKMESYELQRKPGWEYDPINPVAKLFFFDMTNIESEYGDTLGTQQVEWMKTELAENLKRKDTLVLAFAGSSLAPLENPQEDQLRLFLCESNITAYIHGGPHVFRMQEESCYFQWMYKRDSVVTTIHTISPGTIGEFSPERSAQVSIIHVFPDFRYEIERIPIGFNPKYPDYLE